ncbi:MAG: hypothetical protein U0X91_06540 [Spirosomataceae bacterium]
MAKHIVSPRDFKKSAEGKVKRIRKPVGIKDLRKRLKAVDSALYREQKQKAREAEKFVSG